MRPRRPVLCQRGHPTLLGPNGKRRCLGCEREQAPVAGNAVCDSGLVIDLLGMTAIDVDPVGQTASAEGGVSRVHGIRRPVRALPEFVRAARKRRIGLRLRHCRPTIIEPGNRPLLLGLNVGDPADEGLAWPQLTIG